MRNYPLCLNCKVRLKDYRSKRCHRWEGHKKVRNYPFCISCKVQLTDYRTTICQKCYGISLKGKFFIKAHRENISKALTGRKLTPEHIKNSLRRRPMSSLEIKFQQLIDRYKLPYKFVGDGKFMIERKCPDFINTNGEKIAIEVFYRKHKERFANGLENWKQDRLSLFNKYGWDLKFFDETMLNENILKNNLKESD